MQWLWERGESSHKRPVRQSFVRHFCSAAFHPSPPLPISSPAAQLSIPLHQYPHTCGEQFQPSENPTELLDTK